MVPNIQDSRSGLHMGMKEGYELQMKMRIELDWAWKTQNGWQDTKSDQGTVRVLGRFSTACAETVIKEKQKLLCIIYIVETAKTEAEKCNLKLIKYIKMISSCHTSS